MSDIYEKLVERIEAAGVPAEVAEALVNLNKEATGFWGAEGWKDPKAQARFIESRMAYYAGVFHGLGFEFSEEPPAELALESES